MTLRWKNHAGVCLPAWQIKLKRVPTSVGKKKDAPKKKAVKKLKAQRT
jgi:hypothetical protein